LFPDATQLYTPFLLTLSVISIVYGACLALVQNDIKKIIAYSSISHLGYVMLGLVSADIIGIQGAMIQMISHGIVAAGLFLLVGMIYERCHTRELGAYGGLAKIIPVYSVFFMIFTLASVGLPTTSGFTGEFLALLGAFRSAWSLHLAGSSYQLVLACIAVTGVILGALYMLRFALGFLFGAERAPHQPFSDLNGRERTILGILVIAIFALGLFPDSAMRNTELAAHTYRQLITTSRLPQSSAATLQLLPTEETVFEKLPPDARAAMASSVFPELVGRARPPEKIIFIKGDTAVVLVDSPRVKRP
ncbi:MAG: proton-conducting transporter membrane subunit, partial [Gemmatimonadaceae bacterium]